eukprot:TRINITY_DN16043_c0_g1_i2.p1 TRINITY_DN16043_c0_g1~~TRINITY_DN16043_c0_g1_i2.p1  ORF type:complete len:281 (+),score=53.33 TRINITY_DN16043_c0_g1_i2:48-890(+)
MKRKAESVDGQVHVQGVHIQPTQYFGLDYNSHTAQPPNVYDMGCETMSTLSSIPTFQLSSNPPNPFQSKKQDWTVGPSANKFSNSSCTNPTNPERDLEKLFLKYADQATQEITPEGFSTFFTDIGIDLTDAMSLAVPWQLKAKKVGYFTKAEFVGGWRALGCYSLEAMKQHMGKVKVALENEATFKEFYIYVFDYAKGPLENKKFLELQIAIEMWKTTLTHKYPLLNEWVHYLKNNHKKSINRDTWQLFLDFTKTKIDCYDQDGAWPSLIDEFVIYLKNM